MDATSRRSRIKLLLFVACSIGCWSDPARDAFPTTDETLQNIGRRLGRSWSEHDLSAVATRADLLLGVLQPRERKALGQGYLRFKVDSPVVVDVAAPVDSIPFWIHDEGFRVTEISLENRDTAWRLFRKSFEPGWIGLGVNHLDRTPAAHYAVFVRPEQIHDSSSRRPQVTLDHRRSEHWSMTLARAGVSAASDSHRPFQSMPSELLGALLLRAPHDERHRTLLATGRVWKTHVVSTALPDQVTVAFGSDSTCELVWTWRTSPEINTTEIRITRAQDDARHVTAQGGDGTTRGNTRVVTGDSHLVSVRNLLNDPVIRRHRVCVDGLEPDTLYRYSLGDGTPARWGPWQTVKTAPDRSGGVRFLYFGDAQTGLEGWGRLLKAARVRHPSADFLVLAGDLVDRGNERTNWDHFFLRAKGIFDTVPLMPCSGNHEYLDMGPRLYRALFDLPKNGPSGMEPDLVYHFQCGDAFFAVLDSTLASCDDDNAQRQADWLDAALEASNASWKFVIFHHPVYPSHPWRDTPALRERWVPIFDRHHVDFVLQGHDHAYQRTYPMHANRRADGPAKGTIYLIAVSGDKFVDQAPRPYVAMGRSGLSTYQTFEIDSQSNRLTYRAWTEDGRIIDELGIDKSRRADAGVRVGSRTFGTHTGE